MRANQLRAFLIVFSRPLSLEELARVQVRRWNGTAPLPRAVKIRVDRGLACQVFVLGSPRSGTSELGATLSAQLRLPWLGETHIAPAFASSMAALTGNSAAQNDTTRFMSRQTLSELVVTAAQRTYYFVHGAASFLDKTPGVPMIRALPFLRRCFPQARYIFVRRNGISNVLSRQMKFGGAFENHCQDWAAAMNAWDQVKPGLPDYVEIEQETMMSDPAAVAQAICGYLGRPEAVAGITAGLSTGRRERTGAGIGKATFAAAGWTPLQIAQFRKHCAAVGERWGYAME